MSKTLRLILGDQLNQSVSSLADLDKGSDIVLMCEVMGEVTYVRHHKKKVAFILSAMRHFADRLRAQDVSVDYVSLDDPENSGSFTGEVARAVARHDVSRLVVTAPGEFRVLEDMQNWETDLGIAVEIRQDDRFLCPPAMFESWAAGRKQLRMDFFYREMRRHHDVLMADGKPVGGKWNYDADNRERPDPSLKVPAPLQFPPDETSQTVLNLVGRY